MNIITNNFLFIVQKCFLFYISELKWTEWHIHCFSLFKCYFLFELLPLSSHTNSQTSPATAYKLVCAKFKWNKRQHQCGQKIFGMTFKYPPQKKKKVLHWLWCLCCLNETTMKPHVTWNLLWSKLASLFYALFL